MNVLSNRRTVSALVVLLAALVVLTTSVALAQAPGGPAGQAPPTTRMETRDDGSGNWGLVGLLGLLGLAGLLRRDRARPIDRMDRSGRP